MNIAVLGTGIVGNAIATTLVKTGHQVMMDQRAHDIPFTIQTRLSFDVILPLWGRRGPR